MTAANDSVAITPGAGASIATHLVNGKEHQVVVVARSDGELGKSELPASSDVVSGSATVTNSVVQTTILTVPAGRVWKGNVNLSVAWTGTASTAVKFATVQTLGTNVSPVAGTVVLRVNTITADTANSGDFLVIAPVGNAVTLTIISGSALTQVCTASAQGVLL